MARLQILPQLKLLFELLPIYLHTGVTPRMSTFGRVGVTIAAGAIAHSYKAQIDTTARSPP